MRRAVSVADVTWTEDILGRPVALTFSPTYGSFHATLAGTTVYAVSKDDLLAKLQKLASPKRPASA